jgi:hypothetical protein
MTTDTRYRIVGDITINGISKGKGVNISYGNKNTTNFDNVAIIQKRRPLTYSAPYFFLEVEKCGKILSFENII